MSGFETAALFALKTGVDLIQARNQARAQNAAAVTAAQFQRRQAEQAQLIRDNERRERLARALAAQRARFGASGVGGVGGSADAVLQGLTNDTERAIRDDRDLLSLSLEAVDRRLQQQRRRNLLDLADFRRQTAFNALGRASSGFTSLLEP